MTPEQHRRAAELHTAMAEGKIVEEFKPLANDASVSAWSVWDGLVFAPNYCDYRIIDPPLKLIEGWIWKTDDPLYQSPSPWLYPTEQRCKESQRIGPPGRAVRFVEAQDD